MVGLSDISKASLSHHCMKYCLGNLCTNKKGDKPGLFCVAPNRPPVVAVCPNADPPNPPVVPKPASANGKEARTGQSLISVYSSNNLSAKKVN
jgi:hypothetical protein